MAKYCNWNQDGDETSDAWATECGSMFSLMDGDPFDNQMRFCPFCGKPLTVQRFLVADDGMIDWEEPRFFSEPLRKHGA